MLKYKIIKKDIILGIKRNSMVLIYKTNFDLKKVK